MNTSDYAAEFNISHRQVRRDRANGTLIVSGKEVISYTRTRLPRAEQRRQIKAIKQHCDELIQYCDHSDKMATVLTIEEQIRKAKMIGLGTIKGYDRKSIYRKINLWRKRGFAGRKPRSDRGNHRNQTLIANKEMIEQLCESFFMQHALGSLNLVCDMILDHASHTEDLYAIATIPRKTLYRYLTRFSKEHSLRQKHKYMNHNNQWRASQPKVTGAFTDDIQFMQYISGDDHKMDVDGVLFYNEQTGKTEIRKVKIWLWIETKTRYPLDWVITTEDFTAADLIQSLSRAVHRFGLPTENILIDNGIGRADEFQEFWSKLSGKKKPHYSAAYTPTNKATIEGTFKHFKEEFDAFEPNFVSPHKEDGRHPSPALSSPKPTRHFEEYREALERYMLGRFLSRKRRLMWNGKRRYISYGELWNECMLAYQPNMVDGPTIRKAISHTEIKHYAGEIKLGRETYIADNNLPMSLNDRDYTVLSNPYDLSEIDIYAIQDMIVRETGEVIEKGQRVATLINTREHPEKRAQVIKHQKKSNKLFRKAIEERQVARQIEHPTPDSVGANGALLDERAEQRKRTELAVKETIDKLDPANSGLSNEPTKTEDYNLTFEGGEGNEGT